MQHMKRLQDAVTVAFTNPLYAVLLALCPWLPQAKLNKISITALTKVDLLLPLCELSLIEV